MKRELIYICFFLSISLIYSKGQINNKIKFSCIKCDSLFNVAYEQTIKGKYLTSVKVLKTILGEIKNKNLEHKISIYYDIGYNYKNARLLDSAVFYYKKGDKLLTKNINNSLLSESYQNWGEVYYTKSMIDSSMVYLLKALDFAEKSKNYKQILDVKTSLGQLFLRQKIFNKANSYFSECLDIAISQNDFEYVNITKMYLGQLFYERKKLQKAEMLLKEALQYYEPKHHNRKIIILKGFLSKIYMETSRPNKAYLLAIQLMPILNEMEFENDAKVLRDNAIKLNNIAIKDNISIKDQRLADSLIRLNFKATKEPSVKIEQNSTIIRGLKDSDNSINKSNLQVLSEENLNSKFEETINIKDSLYKKTIESKLFEIETKYQTIKKEKENIQLKAENAEQALLTQKANTQKWLFAISAIAIGFITFLLWRRYKSEVRSKKTIQEQKETIEILQKDLHHRVKNNLSVIDAFIEELKDDITDIGLSTKLSELQNRVLSINEVHAQLYKNTDITNIDVKKYVNSIAMNVASTFNRPEIRIEEKVSDNLKLNPSKSSLMGLIINEFITNSFKYAFDKEGEIVIQIDDKNNEIDMTLSDNGKGLPGDFNLEKVTSYGFRIMKLLTLQLEGTFNFQSDNGLKLHIEFPKI